MNLKTLLLMLLALMLTMALIFTSGCSNEDDEVGDELTYYLDADGDGYGDPENPYVEPEPDPITGEIPDPDDEDYVTNMEDCSDDDASINPDADDLPDDGIDQDCDGVDSGTFYRDEDGDGYGNPDDSIIDSFQPDGYVLDNTDCNDNNATIYPFAPEICDDNTDQDCDGISDDGCLTYYRDYDGDGYGDSDDSITDSSQPDGYVLDNNDCDDNDATIYPGASEIPNDGIDQDCNGSDSDYFYNYYYRDSDGDGYGNPEDSITDSSQPDGYVLDNNDCDDNDALIYPGAQDVCGDNIDQDCDNVPDDGCLTYYRDSDGDGYGDPEDSITDSSQPDGYVLDNTDCSDNDAAIYPDASEICGDGIDQDCDGYDKDCIAGDPTFIQTPKTKKQINTLQSASIPSKANDLIAKLTVPFSNSLVRGDVPIFGFAHGKDFKEYSVKYGAGDNPTEWITINSSNVPRIKEITPADLDDSAGITIHGNLATWDTGLSNYVYLPTHPKDHLVNLKGRYTIRLVVTGKDGTKVEDRTILDVADVIPNAWGGLIKSEDEQVILSVPEQAIMDSFRLVSIKPVTDYPSVNVAAARQLIGDVYEIREPDEKFTKDAVLQMAFSEKGTGGVNPNKLGIYGYNVQKKKWEYIESRVSDNKSIVYAKVRKLHSFYAIMASELTGEGAKVASADYKNTQTNKTSALESNNNYLIKNTFENGMGEWSNRDGDVGAVVSLNNSVTFDGTHALKITNTNAGGNFAVNILRKNFDVREYPIVQFDYKISSDVKTNFLVKVEGWWYDIGFTDDYKTLQDKRVNIAHIGGIEGIIADDKWHTARFNLYDMLRTKTGNTYVEEMIMADWDVGGYMKLEFGHNQKGATYYIDNFTIGREVSAGLRIADNDFIVDNFNQMKTTNALGGRTDIFQDTVGGSLKTSFSNEDAGGKGNSLKLSYDVSQKGNYAGYMTAIQNLDLREYQTLSLFVTGIEQGKELMVGLKDRTGNESKVPASYYIRGRTLKAWQKVEIPLVAFSNIMEWSNVENIILSFENASNSKGNVFIDDIAFHSAIDGFMVDDFERSDKLNYLGRTRTTFTSGVAAANGQYAEDASNGIYRISYGGNIGDIKAYASDLFTYAGGETGLGGIDSSQCDTLSFKIRGSEGGEIPNVYLSDGNFRWGVEVSKYTPVTSDWQRVTIPLDDFTEYGVDLTHLATFEIVFEWERMSGTVYLDDIQFGNSADQKKTNALATR